MGAALYDRGVKEKAYNNSRCFVVAAARVFLVVSPIGGFDMAECQMCPLLFLFDLTIGSKKRAGTKLLSENAA